MRRCSNKKCTFYHFCRCSSLERRQKYVEALLEQRDKERAKETAENEKNTDTSVFMEKKDK